MALIAVMIAILVFSALAAALAFTMKVEVKLARNADDEQQLLWLGRSGVEYARWILSQSASIAGEPYDSLNQVWAGGPGGGSESNSPLAGISLNNFPVGDGTVSLKIVDLERKANINTAPQPEIQQALTLMGADADDISVVSDSILDWIDADNDPRIAGAENDYYLGLSPPYHAKNAPIDDLSELLLVKDVTPEMYYGGSSSNLAALQLPRKPKLGFGNAPGQAPDYPFGLKDVFTAVSSGRINLNTADANVLQLIPGVDNNIAEAIIKQRSGPDGTDGTEDDTPFRSPNELAAAGVSQQAMQQIGNLCTVRSSTFEVHVTAHIGDSSREFIAILFRNSGTDIQVVGFYWKQPDGQPVAATPDSPRTGPK
jgi:general secretion pathway protein K